MGAPTGGTVAALELDSVGKRYHQGAGDVVVLRRRVDADR